MPLIPRPDLLDARSPKGLEIFQLTNESLPSSHVYMEAQIFTPDSKRFVLHRSAHPHGSDKNDPEHRYLLCDAASGSLIPLTTEKGATEPSISPDGKWLYYFVDETDLNAGRLSLRRVAIHTSGTPKPETIVVIDKPLAGCKTRISRMYPLSTISSDGKRISTSGYLGDGNTPNAPWGLLVVDIEKAEPRIILQGQTYCNLHPQYSRSLDANASHDILIQENHGCDIDEKGNFVSLVGGPGADIHVIRDDGTNMRDLPWGRNDIEYCQGHQCWRGRSTVAITSAGHPGVKLDIPNPDKWGLHEEVLIEGVAGPHVGDEGAKAPGANERRNEISRNFTKPRFFHFATDIAGERFVSDCNPLNPNHCELWIGKLGKAMCEPMKQWTYLLNMKTAFYTKSAHPHPFLSPDGKLAFFNSNESGTLQAYMVRGLPW